MITNRQKAQQDAVKRLSNNADELIADIERSISMQRGDIERVIGRAGDYTPEVVARVTRMYRDAGWSVTVGPYWMELS